MTIEVSEWENNKILIRYNDRNCFVKKPDFIGRVVNSRATRETYEFDAKIKSIDPDCDIKEIHKQLLEAYGELDDIDLVIPETAVPVPEVEDWEELRTCVNDNLLGVEKEFKVLLASIMSLWFPSKESVYLMLIGQPGCGKTTLSECFEGCKETIHVDEATMQSFAPGTANEDTKTNSLLSDVHNKTLMIHDLTAILGTSEANIRHFIRMLTNMYGREKFTKHSPGTGLKTHNANFNMIFGITPQVLFDKFSNYAPVNEFTRSQKFMFLNIKMDDDVQEKIIMEDIPPVDLNEVRRKVIGFLKARKKEAKEFAVSISKELRTYWTTAFIIFNARNKIWKDEGADRATVHDNVPDYNKTRYWRRFQNFMLGWCLIERKTSVEEEDIDTYFELLRIKK